MKRFIFLLTFLIAVNAAVADTVIFKDGRKLEGKIIKETETSVKLKVKYGEVDIPKSRIGEIKRGPTVLDEYEKKAASLEDSAKAHFELGKWCREKELDQEAKKHFRRALELDRTYSPAGEALGYEEVEGKWLSPEEAKKARGLVKFEGKWIEKEKHEQILAERDSKKQEELRKKYKVGPEFFIMTRSNCILVSDLILDERKRMLKVMEAVYGAIESRFKNLFIKKHDWPLLVFVFRNREDYKRRVKDDGLDGAVEAYGFYSGKHKTSYVFRWPSPSTESLLQHEFTHQVYVERMMIPGPGIRAHAWIFEGVAEYYEGLEFKNGKLGKARPHRMNLGYARHAAKEGKLIPLEKMLEAEKLSDLFEGDYDSQECLTAYGQAWATVYYLLEGEGGKHRSKFERFLKKDLKGEGTLDEFKRIFGRDLDGFQKKLVDFINNLK